MYFEKYNNYKKSTSITSSTTLNSVNLQEIDSPLFGCRALSVLSEPGDDFLLDNNDDNNLFKNSMNNNLYFMNNNNNYNPDNNDFDFDDFCFVTNNKNPEDNNERPWNNYFSPHTEANNDLQINTNPNLLNDNSNNNVPFITNPNFSSNHNSNSPRREERSLVLNHLQLYPNSNLFNDNSNSPRREPIIVLNTDIHLYSKLSNCNFSTYNFNTDIISNQNQDNNIPSQTTNATTIQSQTTSVTTFPSQENSSQRETIPSQEISSQRDKNRYDQPFKGIKTEILKFWPVIESRLKETRANMAIFENIKTNFIHFFTEEPNKKLNKFFLNKSIRFIIKYIYIIAIPEKRNHLLGNITRTGKPFTNQRLREISIEFYNKSLDLVNIGLFDFNTYFDQISNELLKYTYSEYLSVLQQKDSLEIYINKLKAEGHTKSYIENAFLILTELDDYLQNDDEINPEKVKKRKIKSNFKDGVKEKMISKIGFSFSSN